VLQYSAGMSLFALTAVKKLCFRNEVRVPVLQLPMNVCGQDFMSHCMVADGGLGGMLNCTETFAQHTLKNIKSQQEITYTAC